MPTVKNAKSARVVVYYKEELSGSHLLLKVEGLE